MIFYVIIGLSNLVNEAFKYQYESAGEELQGNENRWLGRGEDGFGKGQIVRKSQD